MSVIILMWWMYKRNERTERNILSLVSMKAFQARQGRWHCVRGQVALCPGQGSCRFQLPSVRKCQRILRILAITGDMMYRSALLLTKNCCLKHYNWSVYRIPNQLSTLFWKTAEIFIHLIHLSIFKYAKTVICLSECRQKVQNSVSRPVLYGLCSKDSHFTFQTGSCPF